MYTYMNSLYILSGNLLSDMIYKYFLPFYRFPFHLVHCFLCRIEGRPKSRSLPPSCFPLGILWFKSLIQFELIWQYAVTQWPSFILLRETVQFSQYYLLKTLSFPALYILVSIVLNKLAIYTWAYYWARNSVLLIFDFGIKIDT